MRKVKMICLPFSMMSSVRLSTLSSFEKVSELNELIEPLWLDRGGDDEALEEGVMVVR